MVKCPKCKGFNWFCRLCKGEGVVCKECLGTGYVTLDPLWGMTMKCEKCNV